MFIQNSKIQMFIQISKFKIETKINYGNFKSKFKRFLET